MIAGSYTVKDENDAKRIMKKLDGTYMPPEQQKETKAKILKAKLKAFFK